MTNYFIICLDWGEKGGIEQNLATFGNHVCFFFFFFHTFVRLAVTVHVQQPQSLTFLTFFQLISAYCVLFMDQQISLFSNFFIKNKSHGTIHTFKNYFATVFFSFQFQFSVFSCIQMNNLSKINHFQLTLFYSLLFFP